MTLCSLSLAAIVSTGDVRESELDSIFGKFGRLTRCDVRSSGMSYCNSGTSNFARYFDCLVCVSVLTHCHVTCPIAAPVFSRFRDLR